MLSILSSKSIKGLALDLNARGSHHLGLNQPEGKMAGYPVTLESIMGSTGTTLRKGSVKWEPLGQFLGGRELGSVADSNLGRPLK